MAELGQQSLEVIALPELRFTVLGHAMPGGSKKGFVDPRTGHVRVVEDAKNKPWKRAVALAAREALEAGSSWPEGLSAAALAVTFVFYRERPLSHLGTGANAGVVRAGAPPYPTSRPDVLKLARAAEDALTDVLWVDDSQIVDERLVKCWGEPERLEVHVREL